MTVTAYPKDIDGSNLSAAVTTLTTQLAAIASTSNATKAALTAKLDQAQRELVYHYLDTGRLTAANILSTMT
jgi:hypothetical protein